MLLGWRFSHAVIYVGNGHLVEAWFDRVRERDVAAYPVRDISWFGVRRAPDGSCVMQSRRARVAEYAVSRGVPVMAAAPGSHRLRARPAGKPGPG